MSFAKDFRKMICLITFEDLATIFEDIIIANFQKEFVLTTRENVSIKEKNAIKDFCKRSRK